MNIDLGLIWTTALEQILHQRLVLIFRPLIQLALPITARSQVEPTGATVRDQIQALEWCVSSSLIRFAFISARLTRPQADVFMSTAEH